MTLLTPHIAMRYTLSLLLIVLLALNGCTGETRDRSTVLLFDVSGSVHSDVLADRYRTITDEVLASARPGDYFAGDRISAHSRAQAHLALKDRIPRSSFVENEHFAKARADSVRAALRQQAEALLDAPPARCTDLLGAFDLAARMLKGRDDAEQRLIIASDMVQTCGSVNFRRTNLGEDAIATLIEEERAAGRLPDLSGVTVWVAGAGTDTTLAPKRHEAIEHFWQAYFAAAGADLTPERYAPTLLHWP